MIGKHLFRIGSVFCLSLSLLACSSSSGSSDDDDDGGSSGGGGTVGELRDLDGNYATGCILEAPF